MPFALIIAGLVLLVAGVRGTYPQLLATVKGDFTGPNNFIYWTIAILVVGCAGYIPAIRPLSRSFLVLIIIGLILSNRGFFNKFQSAISTTAKH